MLCLTIFVMTLLRCEKGLATTFLNYMPVFSQLFILYWADHDFKHEPQYLLLFRLGQTCGHGLTYLLLCFFHQSSTTQHTTLLSCSPCSRLSIRRFFDNDFFCVFIQYVSQSKVGWFTNSPFYGKSKLFWEQLNQFRINDLYWTKNQKFTNYAWQMIMLSMSRTYFTCCIRSACNN